MYKIYKYLRLNGIIGLRAFINATKNTSPSLKVHSALPNSLTLFHIEGNSFAKKGKIYILRHQFHISQNDTNGGISSDVTDK